MKLNPEKLKTTVAKKPKFDIEEAVAVIHGNGKTAKESEEKSRYTIDWDKKLHKDILRKLDGEMSIKDYIIGLVKKDLYGDRK